MVKCTKIMKIHDDFSSNSFRNIFIKCLRIAICSMYQDVRDLPEISKT